MSKHTNQNEDVTALNTSVLNNVATILIKAEIIEAQGETGANSSGRLYFISLSPGQIKWTKKKGIFLLLDMMEFMAGKCSH